MKNFYEENAKRITTYRLPPYSPKYNPIEMLWKKIKEKEIHLHYFPTFESLTNKVEEFLIEPLRIRPAPEQTHKVIRISHKGSAGLRLFAHDLLKPQIDEAELDFGECGLPCGLHASEVYVSHVLFGHWPLWPIPPPHTQHSVRVVG